MVQVYEAAFTISCHRKDSYTTLVRRHVTVAIFCLQNNMNVYSAGRFFNCTIHVTY
jgi:hypothetical protein